MTGEARFDPVTGEPLVASTSEPVDLGRTARINLDLDALERPAEKANREPFRAALGEDTITLIDPEELEFDVAMYAAENPIAAVDAALSAEDRAKLKEHRVPLWKIERLFTDYMRYYGFGDAAGNGA